MIPFQVYEDFSDFDAPEIYVPEIIELSAEQTAFRLPDSITNLGFEVESVNGPDVLLNYTIDGNQIIIDGAREELRDIILIKDLSDSEQEKYAIYCFNAYIFSDNPCPYSIDVFEGQYDPDYYNRDWIALYDFYENGNIASFSQYNASNINNQILVFFDDNNKLRGITTILHNQQVVFSPSGEVRRVVCNDTDGQYEYIDGSWYKRISGTWENNWEDTYVPTDKVFDVDFEYHGSLWILTDTIKIIITLDKKVIEVGETVTASYSITGGSGEYDNIQLTWMQRVTGSEAWTGMESESLINGDDVPTIGTYSYTPAIGGQLRLEIFAEDSQSRVADKYSETIIVNEDAEYEPLAIAIMLDKTEIEVGETVTASYSITGGNGEYDNIQLTWMQRVTGSEAWTGMESESLINGDDVSIAGTYSYTPTFSGKLQLEIFVGDSQSRIIDRSSEIINVKKTDPDFIFPSEIEVIDVYACEGIAAKYIFIPEGTKDIVIKEGAFSNNITLRYIYVPSNVREIAGNAFQNTNCTIITPKGSYAEQWAIEHNNAYCNE